MKPIALVSMPWMLCNMPSIQLATVAHILREDGYQTESFEFNLDYARAIGLPLYGRLCQFDNALAEWLFSRHFYHAEYGNRLASFKAERSRLTRHASLIPDEVLDFLFPVTEKYLLDCLAQTDWSRFQVVGFSLTISQTAASMALARLIKMAHPEVKIVFGGTSCAGVMGSALMATCPYIDVVVHSEAEPILGQLMNRIESGHSLANVAGISYRDGGSVVTTKRSPLHSFANASPIRLDFDDYFARLKARGLSKAIRVMLPFESSRGCWYGEKNHCTFCGLHEVMKFREKNVEQVVDELEYLSVKYDNRNFFCVDLIAPRYLYTTLVSQLKGRDYSIFYEIKANAKAKDVQALSEAGINWVQPGIESLSDDLLRLMRKGVSAVQNLVLLIQSQIHGIRVSWNLLSEVPGARPEYYLDMVELIPALHHLQPPSGLSQLQIHRFSPYFNEPEKYGLSNLRRQEIFEHVYPVDRPTLEDLVFAFDYDDDHGVGEAEPRQSALRVLGKSVEHWSHRYHDGAFLEYELVEGGAEIFDSRVDGSSVCYTLSQAEIDVCLNYASPAKLQTNTIDDQATPEQTESYALIARLKSLKLLIELSGKALFVGLPGPSARRQQWIRDGRVQKATGVNAQ